MANQYLSYRLTKVPPHFGTDELRQLFPEDWAHITKASIAPSPMLKDNYNVLTVSFNHKPTFHKFLADGKTYALPTSLPDAHDIRIDNNFFGLTPLNNPTEGIDANLIAVTGLAGRGCGSWQNDIGEMWLRDYLPIDIPKLRVFIYGYPSKLHKSLANTSLLDYTDEFLHDVSTFQSQPKEMRRPLVLVGHSLGCIIIKQALVQSFSLTRPNFEFLWSICGLVFFGAPHRGLHNRALENILGEKPPAQLVQELKPGSFLLTSLNRDFPLTCKDIKVITCFERVATPTVVLDNPNDPESSWSRVGPAEFAVPRESACLFWQANETVISIHANHSEIAKLDNSAGSAYHHIKEEIQKLVQGAEELVRLRFERDLSIQDVLSLFFMFQYESSWYGAWKRLAIDSQSHSSASFESSRFMISDASTLKIPYEYKACDIAAGVQRIMERIELLIKPHRRSGELDKPRSTPRGPLSDGNIALSAMLVGSERTSILDGSLHEERKKYDQLHEAYDIGLWSDAERLQFRNLIHLLHEANRMLLETVPPTESIDIIASSNFPSKFAKNSTRLTNMQETLGNVPAQLWPSLLERASLKRQLNSVSINTDTKLLKSITSIKFKSNTHLSNQRFLTSFKNDPKDTQEKPISVLVEWKSYDMPDLLELAAETETQVRELAHNLEIPNKPPLLKSLRCLGYIHDTDRTRFGFIFKLPSNVDHEMGFLTLRSYIRGTKRTLPLPTLAERLDLARSLALCLFELHCAGWLHKSLHSNNILLFYRRFTQSLMTDSLFVSGFEISRRDREGEILFEPEDSESDLYRHFELRDPSNKTQGRPYFRRKHDVYALGLLLFEIGIWDSITNIREIQNYKDKDNPYQFSERLKRLCRSLLPHQMGKIYLQVVLTCLSGGGDATIGHENYSSEAKSQGISDDNHNGKDGERSGSSLDSYVWMVIRELERCHCRG